MTVKEILITACRFMQEDEIADKISDDLQLSEEQQLTIKDLLKCYNFIQNEIATEYIPLMKIEKIKSDNGAFSVANLTERFAYVISLKDEVGASIKYKIVGDKLLFDGKAELCYCYCPKKAELSNESELLLPERVVALGVAREYYLLHAMPSEASMFEEKFKFSLQNFMRKKNEIIMPKRIWR